MITNGFSRQPVIPAACEVKFFDQDMEGILISTLLKEPSIYWDLGSLEPQDFSNVYFANTFYVIQLMMSAGTKIDPFSVVNKMSGLSPEFAELAEEIDKKQILIDVMQQNPKYVDTAGQLAEQIHELACSRKAYQLAQKLQVELMGSNGANFLEIQARHVSELDALASTNINLDNCYSGEELVDMAFRDYLEEMDRPKDAKSDRLHSGLDSVDSIITSFNPGTLNIVAGRPGMGKTVFGDMVCRNFTNQIEEGCIVVFSLEMLEDQMSKRLMSSLSGVPIPNITNGEVGENYCFSEKLEKIVNDKPKNLNRIFYDFDSNITIRGIRNKLRMLERKHKKIKGIMIDYLQLFKDVDPKLKNGNFNQTNNVGWISQELKRIAKEFRCPVILLSQLNRNVESRQDKHPMISDLRDSGNIEQDADIIILLYREKYYNKNFPSDITEINIAKQRQGPSGTAYTEFKGNSVSFKDGSSEEVERYRLLLQTSTMDNPSIGML